MEGAWVGQIMRVWTRWDQVGTGAVLGYGERRRKGHGGVQRKAWQAGTTQVACKCKMARACGCVSVSVCFPYLPNNCIMSVHVSVPKQRPAMCNHCIQRDRLPAQMQMVLNINWIDIPSYGRVQYTKR